MLGERIIPTSTRIINATLPNASAVSDYALKICSLVGGGLYEGFDISTHPGWERDITSVGVEAPPLYYTEGVAHWVCSCVSVYCSLIHASAPKTSQVNGPYASAHARRRGPLCVVRVIGQGTVSPCSSCLRNFCALDGWEDVGDPELLVDTSG